MTAPDPRAAGALAVAHRLADAARLPILTRFRAPGLAVDDKAGPGAYDPVTAADREAEAAMRAVLAHHRPEDGVLGEEAGETVGTAGLRWVLDPVDGTRAFVIGAPTWGVLIGLQDVAGPAPRAIAGMMDQPWTGDRWWGDGAAAWARRRGGAPVRIRTSGARTIETARACTTYPEVGAPEEGAAWGRIARRARLCRYGLDCTSYALLAEGHVDVIAESGLQVYDICALIPLIRGAGGVITDWTGGAPDAGGRILAAATPELHAEALAALAG